MTPGDRLEPWQLLVLAYVDGELDPASRLEVEAWIDTRPEVAELFRELSETGWENKTFRTDADLPDPKPVDLRRSGEIILARLRPAMARRKWAWLRPAILSGVAASMAGMLFLACPNDRLCDNVVQSTPSKPAAAPGDPLAGFDDLPIADSSEARVSAVRGDVSPLFVSCDDLLPVVLDLATVDEMQIARQGRNAFSVPQPGDAPMIYQTRAAK